MLRLLHLDFLLLHLPDHPPDHVYFQRTPRDRRRRPQHLEAVVVALLFHQDVRRIETVIHVARRQLNRLQVEHVRLVQLFMTPPVKHSEAVIGGRKARVQLDRGPQAALHLVSGVAAHQRQPAEVVLRQTALWIESDGLLVPLLRFLVMAGAQFDVAHGFVGLLVVGIRFQHRVQYGACIVTAPVVGQEIRPDRVGLRIGQRRHFQQRGIDGRHGTVHVEVHVPRVTDVVRERRLQLLQIAEGLFGRRDGVFVLADPAEIGADAVGMRVEIGEFEVVDQRPGFGVEHRAFLFLVVVRRVGVHLEKHGQRNQLVLAQVDDVVRTRLADHHVLVADIGVLEELRQPLI